MKKIIVMMLAMICLILPAFATETFVSECSILGIDENASNITNITYIYTGVPTTFDTWPYQGYVTNLDTDVNGTVQATLKAKSGGNTTTIYESNWTYSPPIINTDGILEDVPVNSTIILELERLEGNITRWEVCTIQYLTYDVVVTETIETTTNVLELDAFTEGTLGAINTIQTMIERLVLPPINTFYYLWIYVLQYVFGLLAVVYAFKVSAVAIANVMDSNKNR